MAWRREIGEGVFADTFYWVALTNPADPYYRAVVSWTRDVADPRIITTDAVLAEFLTFFSEDPRWRNRACRTVRALLDDPDVEIFPESRSTFLSGLELYCDRSDKGYSMTDLFQCRPSVAKA